MNIYYSTDFTGHNPIPTGIMCRADDKEEARQIFEMVLSDYGLTFDGTIDEMKTDVVIFSTGEY